MPLYHLVGCGWALAAMTTGSTAVIVKEFNPVDVLDAFEQQRIETGLHHFPHSEILVSRTEAKTASGFSGRLNGYLNNHFPDWFDPKVIDLAPVTYGPFPQSLTLPKQAM